MDMTEDLFADTEFGQIALEKIKPTSPNFRLYCAGWIEKGPPATWDTMEVNGAEFRVAKTGPNKGLLTVLVPGTKQTAYVTKSEMKAHKSKLAELAS